jgi:hypothetical protein
MDTFVEKCYIVGYETARNTPSIGAATASGHTLARIWPQLPFSGRSCKLIAKFGRAMAPVVPGTRTEGLTCQSKSRSAAIAEHRTEEDISTDLVAWTTGFRLLDRSVDSSPDRRRNRQGIWDTVFTCQLLEADDGLGLELSEAHKARQRKKRSSDPHLEAVGVAAYKKTQRLTEPIWCFRTKVDFSWCPLSFAPGHREATLPSCGWQGHGQRYRPFQLSVFLQSEDKWLCIFSSTPTKTSGPSKWSSSSATCCDIFGDPSYWCGTEAEPTGQASSTSSWTSIHESMFTSSQGMLRSLTPMNWSGPSSNEPWQTVFPIISRAFVNFFHEKLDGCNDPRKGCGHVFVRPICRSHEAVSIN